MYSNVEYVMDFTNFSEYDEAVEFSKKNDEIRKMLAEGESSAKVAKKFGMDKAKVDLIGANGARSKIEKILPSIKNKEAKLKMLETARKITYTKDEVKGAISTLKETKPKAGESFAAYRDRRAAAEKLLDKNKKAKEIQKAMTKGSGFNLIPKSTEGKVAAGAGAAALATLGSLAVAGSKGVGPMATDNAKIARANRLIAKGQIDKANKILDSVKDKSKLVQPQAYAASEVE